MCGRCRLGDQGRARQDESDNPDTGTRSPDPSPHGRKRRTRRDEHQTLIQHCERRRRNTQAELSIHHEPFGVGVAARRRNRFIHPPNPRNQSIYLIFIHHQSMEEGTQSGRGERAMMSEAPGQAAYLVETADVMDATATNLLLPLRRRQRAASGGERLSATSLRRSAILETNGKRSRKRRRRRPSRDGDVGGGAWWRARGTSKRQRARAILHLRFGSGAWVLAASPPLQAAADTAGRHSAVGPCLCPFLRAPDRNYRTRPLVLTFRPVSALARQVVLFFGSWSPSVIFLVSLL